MDFYVYHLIDPKNNLPFYVGKGRGNRMYHHESLAINGYPNGNTFLYNKIRKVLRESGKIEYRKEKENLTESEAIQSEISDIKKFGRRKDGGTLCNLTMGGEGISGYQHTYQCKKKMSILAKTPKRIKVANKNVKKAILKNMGWRKLENNHDEIIKAYKKLPMKKLCKKFAVCFYTMKKYLVEKNVFVHNKNRERDSLKTRIKKSIANKGKASRAVIQYSLNGDLLKTWPNMSLACDFLGKSNRQGDICSCCTGRQKTAFGYKWKYKS